MHLMAGLLSHVRQIVGDGASYAMLHYSAVEEGKKLGADVAPGDFSLVLRRLEDMLGQRAEVMREDRGIVTVRVHDSALLRAGTRPMQGIVVGLLEGSLSSSRSWRYKGTVISEETSGFTPGFVVELRPEP